MKVQAINKIEPIKIDKDFPLLKKKEKELYY